MSMTVYGHEIMLQETVGTYREKNLNPSIKIEPVTDGVDATV